MNIRDLKQKSVPVHDFSMNPSPEIARSVFPVRQGHKIPFSFSKLIPLYIYDVLPGDQWACKVSASARTAVPIVPILDNWTLDLFAFFTPYRLVWTNFVKMMGEQENPGDSISYTVPTMTSPPNGYAVSSLQDYMGLPTVGQVTAAQSVTHSALFTRAYNLIYNKWFRDENLQNAAEVGNNSYNGSSDGPDDPTRYTLLSRGKRPDYFTTALPWPQKGNTAVTTPLGTTAPVVVSGTITTGNSVRLNVLGTTTARQVVSSTAGTGTTWGALSSSGQPVEVFADLSQATAATINQLRTSIAIQQLLERDARGGTRYKEMIYSQFKVIVPDARLQRPEYIGGGTIPIQVNAVPQTSSTGLTGATTPMGTLAGTGYAIGTGGFSYAATEHGCIIVLAAGRADLTYSQGLPRMWSKSTRYDFFLPVLEGLGEQAILNKEIYCVGGAAGGQDDQVFGYGPRWDEYRHFPSRISGLFRPTAASNIAYWHSSQQFSALPTLNTTFITDNAATVLPRNLAGGTQANDQQVIGDFMCMGSVARSMRAFGVPGLTRF